MPAGRVLVAGGNPLAASPSWTRYDQFPNCRCSGWDADVGRSSVFEVTDVGTATVHFHDRAHTLNTAGLIGRAIQLQILDPTTGVWEPSYRGVIDEAGFDVYELTPGLMSTVQLHCVDLFAYLARTEMTPGRFGHPPAHGFVGSVTFGKQKVADRIRTILYGSYTDGTGLVSYGGAQVPPEMAITFTGNVWLWDVAYDPGESALTALRESAEADLPGIGQMLCDRRGRICFHGRRSRFEPEALIGTPDAEDWTFTRWNAGDSTEVAATPGTAQIRELHYTRSAGLIYNAAIAWPRYVLGKRTGVKRIFDEKKKKDQVYADAGSIADYGVRSMPPMGDLLVHSNFNNGNTGTVECQKYAEYYVQNYKGVHKIPVVTFKSVHPSRFRAAATWALLTRIEISDVINLTATAAEMNDEGYFVEGWSKSVRPLTPDYDMVELTPNLSSEDRYLVNPFLPWPS